MNQIIRSLLSDFITDHQLSESIEEDVAFEHFATNLTTGILIDETLNTINCVLGEDAQPGVDSIATIINGRLVLEVDDIETFVEMNSYLDVDFVFVQAKTSSSFSTSALGDLADFVDRIFSDGPSNVDNDKVKNFGKLKNAIYNKSRYFKRRRPIAHLYYVSTGQKPNNDANFEGKEKLIRKRLLASGDIEELKIDLIGSSELQKRSLQIQNSVIREILFPKRVTLPDVPNVAQAFLGALPIAEFLKLIKGENDNLLSSIFYDNVRDWQGHNSVNEGIHSTLSNSESRARFVLMNNGITVIAKKLRLTGGDRLTLEDYQIVNGCQTTNVIWESRADPALADATVPIKIVATENESVVQDIIRATNSQTEVTPSQLLAVTDFQKELELYFGSQGANSLFYERRSKQFINKPIDRSRIVTPLGLIKSYSSMFLEEPHKTTRDFGSVLEKVGSEIFGPDHKHDHYYLAALAFYWIQTLLPKINPKLGVAKYQVLLCVRLLYEDNPPPPPNARQSTKYASKLLLLFKDTKTAEKTLKPAMDIVANLLRGKNRDAARTSPFTQSVKDAVSRVRKGSRVVRRTPVKK